MRHPDLLRYVDGIEVFEVYMMLIAILSVISLLDRTSYHVCDRSCRAFVKPVEPGSKLSSSTMGLIQSGGKEQCELLDHEDKY